MRYLFSFFYQSLNLVALLLSAYFAAYHMQSHWVAVATIAAAPLLQATVGFDKPPGPDAFPSKVKLPLVTLFMMLGTAWLLLSVPQAGLALWLGFACVGGFILNTYWVRE
jgi:hypothetical protein